MDNCNKEASAYFRLDEEQYKKVMTLYKDAILLDDELYAFILSQADDDAVVKKVEHRRSHEENIECLMAEDFPDETGDIIELHSSKAYKWLKKYLATKEEKSAYFGELSSVIHDVFVREPRPFRKDIKTCLANLLASIKANKDTTIVVSKPNYSEKVSLSEY